jgi:hypothetical protein
MIFFWIMIVIWFVMFFGINWFLTAQERDAEIERRVKWENKYYAKLFELEEYKRMFLRTARTNHKPKVNIDKDLLDAVRRGMMAAHPDRGGKQEDFIRFHKVYEDLKKNS